MSLIDALLLDADPPTQDFPISFRSLWQIRRFVYEGNICELYAYDQATSDTLPNGVSTLGYYTPPPFTFPGAIYRGNFFRLVDNSILKQWNNGTLVFDSPLALAVESSENTLIENNVIEFIDPRAIGHFISRNTTAFNNLNPNGARLPVFNAIAPGNTYERETTVDERIEDALVCSML